MPDARRTTPPAGTYARFLGTRPAYLAGVLEAVAVADVFSDVVTDGSITNAKLANVAAWTIKGRPTASAGAPSDIAPAHLSLVSPALTDWVIGWESSGELRRYLVSKLVEIINDTTPQLGGNLDVNGNEVTSNSNGDVTLNPHGTGETVLKKLETRYRRIRVPFRFVDPADGDIVTIYVAGHSGAGAKAPYAKVTRWAANVEGASASLDMNLYIRTVDAEDSGGTAVHTTGGDKTVTAYGEYTSFDNDGIDSTADGSADECLVVEITAINTQPTLCNGWVEIEIQD